MIARWFARIAPIALAAFAVGTAPADAELVQVTYQVSATDFEDSNGSPPPGSTSTSGTAPTPSRSTRAWSRRRRSRRTR